MFEREEQRSETPPTHQGVAEFSRNEDEGELLHNPIWIAIEVNIMVLLNRALIAIHNKDFEVGTKHVQDAIDLVTTTGNDLLMAQCRFWEGMLYAEMERDRDACATFLGAMGVIGVRQFESEILLQYLSKHWQTTISVINEHYEGDSSQISDVITILQRAFNTLEPSILESAICRSPPWSNSLQRSSITSQPDRCYFETLDDYNQLAEDSEFINRDDHVSIWEERDLEMSPNSTASFPNINQISEDSSNYQVSTGPDRGGGDSDENLFELLLNDVHINLDHEVLYVTPIMESDHKYVDTIPSQTIEEDLVPDAVDDFIKSQLAYRPPRRR